MEHRLVAERRLLARDGLLRGVEEDEGGLPLPGLPQRPVPHRLADGRPAPPQQKVHLLGVGRVAASRAERLEPPRAGGRGLGALAGGRGLGARPSRRAKQRRRWSRGPLAAGVRAHGHLRLG